MSSDLRRKFAPVTGLMLGSMRLKASDVVRIEIGEVIPAIQFLIDNNLDFSITYEAPMLKVTIL